MLPEGSAAETDLLPCCLPVSQVYLHPQTLSSLVWYGFVFWNIYTVYVYPSIRTFITLNTSCLHRKRIHFTGPKSRTSLFSKKADSHNVSGALEHVHKIRDQRALHEFYPYIAVRVHSLTRGLSQRAFDAALTPETRYEIIGLPYCCSHERAFSKRYEVICNCIT